MEVSCCVKWMKLGSRATLWFYKPTVDELSGSVAGFPIFSRDFRVFVSNGDGDDWVVWDAWLRLHRVRCSKAEELAELLFV